MSMDTMLFWFLSAVVVIPALAVILLSNPVYSALSLVMTMVGVAAVFATLNAYFLAGVQLIVYTGAVMVLFVMVLMLFDLKHEISAFTRGKFTGAIKIATVGLLSGLVVGAIVKTVDLFGAMGEKTPDKIQTPMEATKNLGNLLFTKYVFGFEALGVLLLVIAVGTVALSRSKGGTHAKH